jgi:glycosyltransferase involved in cell wall biosynthesis
MLLQCRRGDVLVATSHAALRAVTSLLDQTVEILYAKCPTLTRQEWQRPDVDLVPLGVDDRLLNTPDRRYARRILELPEGSRIALYVGRFSEEYKADLEPLLRAVKAVVTALPETLLVIAGHDSSGYSDRLRRLAGDLGIADNVICLVNVPRHTRTLLYAAADIFVSPVDNIQESFGLAVIEAMASGLPVVASDWSGYRELVMDGVTGFLVETAFDPTALRDASITATCAMGPFAEHQVASRTIVNVGQLTARMRQLLTSEHLRMQMGENARNRVRDRYLWSSVINQFGELWNRQILLSREHHNQSPESSIDLDKVFSHYASASLGSELILLSADANIEQDCRRLGISENGLKPLLDTLSGRPALLSEFARKIGHRAVFTLLKKGVLKVYAKTAE